MEETESQIAKIALGNSKSSSTYVYTMAEKAPVGEAELYVVAELPIFNPAAEESCERICLAIGSTLKRAYRKVTPGNNFENAISQVNEELGKLASMGQTNWVYKLNCILATKEGNNFNIATCGKVSAYLLRNGQFTDISCSQDQSHPLKTFENFASGKIRLGDLLLLSTTELFNHLSMDRILNIFENSDFLTSTRTIIQLLKDGADSQTSFGVLLNLQVQPGQNQEENVDLENYAVEENPGQNIWQKGLTFVKSVFAINTDQGRKPQTALPKVSFSDRIKNISGNTKSLFNKSKGFVNSAKTTAQSAASNMNREKFKALSPIKKFFLISVVVLLIAVVSSIFVAMRVNKQKQVLAEVGDKLTKIESLLDSAESSLLYKDYNSAGKSLVEAKNLLPNKDSVPDQNKAQYEKVTARLNAQAEQMEKPLTVEVKDLGSLGQADRLIRLPGYTAVRAGNAIISYNTQTGQIQDGQLKAGGAEIISSVYISGNNSVIYDGNALYVWDSSASKIGPGFSQNLPAKEDFAGMSFYATNSRVYVLDRKNSRIMNYLVASGSLSKPVVAINDASLSTSEDITIDGAIYALTQTGVTKFQSGKLAEFNFPQLPVPYGGKGKIYTQKDFANVYILDSQNNRIIITDKTGSLVNTIKSDQFNKLTDFQIDEKGKTIYLLSDGKLLKTSWQ